MSKPKIRFKGFADDWEQRKLGEIGKASSGIGFPDNEQGGKEGIPFYKVSDMNLEGNEIEMTVSNNYVTEEQIARKKWLPLNDLPAMYFAKVGAAVMLNRKRLCRFPFLFDNNTMAYSLKKEHWDANFAKAEFAIIDLTKLVQVGALPSYNASDVESIKIMIPSLTEQAKIGEYFSNLDQLITLHQRKCDEIKKLKKYMLQNMFPQDEEKIPKIRFAGFTDDWEQRKLGKIFVSMQNNTLSRADLSYDRGIAMNIHYGDILVKFGEVIDIKSERLPMILDETILDKYKSSALKNGDIIIADTAEDETVGKCTEIAGLSDEYVISGLHTIPYRPLQKFAFGYLGYYMNSTFYHNQLLPLMQGIKVTSISKVSLQNTVIIYPKSKVEQAAIGKYFYNLDNLITLHQRKCDELKKMKKFMLQNMFV